MFSPDGHLLASASDDRTIVLWDVARRTRLATLQPAVVFSMAFSADSRTLAAGGTGGTITLWDVASRTRRATLTGHTGKVTSLVFSPDGNTVISASADHTIIPWSTDPEQTITRICTVIRRDLSQPEWAQLAPGVSYHHICTGGLPTSAGPHVEPIRHRP